MEEDSSTIVIPDPSAGNASEPSESVANRPRACDSCRVRKIRCNREWPCAHCVRAGIECVQADNKNKEKRTRIHLSSQYERKIDLIEHRLDGVIKLLEDLKATWPPGRDPSVSPAPPPTHAHTPLRTHTVSTPSSDTYASRAESTGPVVEGDSSMAAHSAFARDFLGQTVDVCSPQYYNAEMRETLDSLNRIVHAMKPQAASSEMSYPNAKPSQRPTSAHQLPPIEQAVAIMQIAKESTILGESAWVYEFLSLDTFPDICLRVYFSPNYSEADFITVNAGLYRMFMTYTLTLTAGEREQYTEWINMCRDNLETALSNLPLHLPANSDMITALLFGIYHAIEISKPSLAWILSSKTSELCQTLGYHRAVSMKGDKPDVAEHKQFLFWCAYFADKALSLRLGRASTIQDWDVSIPLPTENPAWTADNNPFKVYFSVWILGSRCQGRIYELLYSPGSIAQPDHVRAANVETLVAEIGELTVSEGDVHRRFFDPENVLQRFFALSDHVFLLSMLTLVHRAAPRKPGSGTTFNDECVRVARDTLASHEECVAMLEEANPDLFPIYVLWTLLFAPFTPFIVLFCNVIETQDAADLRRLQDFNKSMERAPTVSESAARMHRLFQVLYKVAHQYVETHATASAEQARAAMGACLSTLGFPSANGVVPGAGQVEPTLGEGVVEGGMGEGGGDPMMWIGSGTQLDDWFYNTSQMMGMLEESDFHFPT